MAFGSIGQFRAALNSLVASTGQGRGTALVRRNPAAAPVEHSIRQGSNPELARDVAHFTAALKKSRREGDQWGISWWGDRLAGVKDEIKRRKKAGSWKEPRKARANMAIRMLPGGAIEADTPEELARFAGLQQGGLQQGGLSQAGPFKAPVAQGGGSRSTRKAAARRPFTGQLRSPEGPVDFGQAKIIGQSIGGLVAYCPELAGKEGGSHQKALAAMGLTKGRASAVIDALNAAGVCRWHLGIKTTPDQQAQARAILTEVGGVSCPTPSRGNPWAMRAKRNPWAVRAKRNMAGRPRQFGLPAAELGDPVLSKMRKAELEALGTVEAQYELARRENSRLLRAGVSAPPARVAKRKKAKKNPQLVSWTRAY